MIKLQTHRRSAAARIAATVAAAALGLSACTGSPSSPPANHTPPSANYTPQAAASHEPQPFDVVLGDKVGLIEHARMKLQFACMAKAGYPQNLQALGTNPVNVFDFLTVGVSTWGWSSEQEARQRGFGSDQPGTPARIISFDANYDASLERCRIEADQTLGRETADLINTYGDLVNKLASYRGEVDKEVPSDLSAKVLECLTHKGYSIPDKQAFLATPKADLLGIAFGHPETGHEEQWAPKNEPGTVQIGPAIPMRRYLPTGQESDLAAAWFQCDQQTKRVDLILAAAYTVQAKYLERYQVQFDELNPKVEERAKKAAELVAR